MKPSAGHIRVSGQAHHLLDVLQRKVPPCMVYHPHHPEEELEAFAQLSAAREAIYSYISDLEEQVGIERSTYLRF